MASTLPDEQLWMWMTQGSASARTARQQRKGACRLMCLPSPCAPPPPTPLPPQYPSRTLQESACLLIFHKLRNTKVVPCIWIACCHSKLVTYCLWADMKHLLAPCLTCITQVTMPLRIAQDSVSTLSNSVIAHSILTSHSVPTCSLACLDQGISGVRKLLAAVQISSGPQHS